MWCGSKWKKNIDNKRKKLTNIISRYLSGEFNPSLNPTVGSSYGEKRIKKEGITYLLKVWDTVGQEKYNSITKLFVQGSHIIILVYSIDNLHSFQKLDFWHNFIKNTLKDDTYILAVIGNKRDLYENELVSEEEGKKYAEKMNANYALLSAKTDRQNIINFFDILLNEYINKFGKNTNLSISLERKSERSTLKEEIVELKVILLGDVGVGKTNIISRYLSGEFNPSLNPTVGSSYGEKRIKKDVVKFY